MIYVVNKSYPGITGIYYKGKEVESFRWELTKSVNIDIVKSTLLIGKSIYGIVFEKEEYLVAFVDDILYGFAWVEKDRIGKTNKIEIISHNEIVDNFVNKHKSGIQNVETDKDIERKMKKFEALDKISGGNKG